MQTEKLKRVIDLLEPYLEAPKAAPPSPIAREAHDG